MKDINNKLDNNSYRILTEQINLSSLDLDTKSTYEIVKIFSAADKEPQKAVKKAIPDIVSAIDAITLKLKSDGRLFYIGSGTSGLGTGSHLDANGSGFNFFSQFVRASTHASCIL